ncbi:hypothetical protein J1N35_026446 [Gossypium stocksii]|uniref:Uncharacterized protein n=1 Tax=Gossypium stocksii TaxID=47602 RepID=A0A9D3ZZ87_9ROSI|nr:hypothetical protein J1N35_026446 [Gossypium stocksii]
MGLSMEMNHYSGLETQIEVGREMCLTEKERQNSNNEGSPNSKQKSTKFSETEGSRNQVTSFEIEEELFQTIQKKRKKKVLNKRIRSMRRIQDRVLTTKEKLNRDKGMRKEKGKEDSRFDKSIANLSLLDSDINNRRKVILKEAKKICEVGKKLGFSVQGRSGGLITVWDKGLFKANIEYCENRFIVIEGKWLCEGSPEDYGDVGAPVAARYEASIGEMRRKGFPETLGLLT